MHELDVEAIAERRHHVLRLARPQQAVIHEDACQLLANCPLHQRRRDRRVDAAGQATDGTLSANLGPDRRHLVVDDVGLGPGRPRPGYVVEKVLEHLLPVRGVHHLGVELHPGETA